MATVTKSIGAAGDYNTIAAWLSDLSNGSVYTSGDTAIGEIIDWTIAGGVTFPTSGVLPTTVTLQAHSTVKTRGIPGSGCRLLMSSAVEAVKFTNCSYTINLSGFEVDYEQINTLGSNGAIYWGNNSVVNIDSVLVYNPHRSARTGLFRTAGNAGTSTVTNCIAIRDSYYAGSGAGHSYFMAHNGGSVLLANCAAVAGGNLFVTATRGGGFVVNSNTTVRNCVSVDSYGLDFTGTPAAASNNISSDGSAPGSDSITSVQAENVFNGAIGGNFTPRPAGVAIGAGIAVAGVSLDAAGNTRPDPPSIGPMELVSAGGGNIIVIED